MLMHSETQMFKYRKYQSKLYDCYLVKKVQYIYVIQLLVIFHILMFVHVIFPYFCLHAGYRRSKVSAHYGISCRLVEI